MTNTFLKIKLWLDIREGKKAIRMMKTTQKLWLKGKEGQENEARNATRKITALLTSSFSIVGSLEQGKIVNRPRAVKQSTCSMESHLNLRF